MKRAERDREHLNAKQSLLAGTQSRLAQVEQERDGILQLYNSAWLWVQQRVKHPNSGLPPAAMTLMEMLPLLNQRAIQLCKDKAAEWKQKAKVMAISDENHSVPAIKASAANELARELEKL